MSVQVGIPQVAPFESCIACFKGDTQTVVQVEGCAEWCMAMLHVKAGIGHDEAVRTFLMWAGPDKEPVTGSNRSGGERGPGLVPSGRIEFGFRLCRDCAAHTDVEVTVLGESGPVYRQPFEVPPSA